MYYAMLCTNWLNPNLYNGETSTEYDSERTFWIKISCEWITLLIYLYSLIAPTCFPDRNFD